MADSYVSSKLKSFGLIDVNASPTTRVETQALTTEGDISIMEVPDRVTDPDGATVFSSFRSMIGVNSADINNFSQADTWLSGHTAVQAVGVTPDAFIQWYDDTRIVPTEEFNISESDLVRAQYALVRDAGDLATHGVYVTRNGLLDLAPENGGWADTDGDNTPDGYTETALNSTDFTSNVYSAFVDTGTGTGSINATIPFPLDDREVTLSIQVDQLHDDGNNAVRIEALDDAGSVITGGVSNVTFTTTGRKSATLTTPDGTHQLKVYPIRVTSVTANNSKFQIQDPCLRTRDQTVYVPR